MDLGVWALNLGLPSSVVAEGPEPHPECAPLWLKVRYDFAATQSTPATRMFWYSGAKRPEVPGTPDLSKWGGGTLFVGSKGMLLADYGLKMNDPDTATMAVNGAIVIANGIDFRPYLKAVEVAEDVGDAKLATQRLRQAYAIAPEVGPVRAKVAEYGLAFEPTTGLPPGL